MKTLTLALFSILIYGQTAGKVIYVSEFANGLKTGDSWENSIFGARALSKSVFANTEY